MPKTTLSVLAVLFTLSMVHAARSQTAPAAPAPHLPRGTATDVSGADIEATVKKTAASPVSDQQIRVADIGEYNIGVGVVHRAPYADPEKNGNGIEHSQITEVYHFIRGAATFVTGGTIENPRESPPESSVVKVLNGPSTGGGKIVGGVSRRVAAGDVVIIPPNTPHWFSKIDEEVVYLVVRVDPHHVLPTGYVAK